MRKKILLLAVLVVASATTIDAQRKFPFFWKKKKAKTEQTTPAKKESEYDKLFKKKHETAKGLITLHLLDGKVYFELPVDLINKDMLIGSTVTSISDNGNAVVGSKPTDLLHVMFTRNKTHVQLRQVNTDYITGSTQIDEPNKRFYDTEKRRIFQFSFFFAFFEVYNGIHIAIITIKIKQLL